MNRFDDENKIISDFQNVKDGEVLFVTQSSISEDVYHSIHTKTLWDKWINSSGKSDPPPDYYLIDEELMMDVMRVDDHAFMDAKGKVQNPTNVGESKLYNELKNSGILELFPNAEPIINAKTMLPTEQDHNYMRYRSNFERVVSEHIKKIPLYQQNHPRYKTILFVMDESSAYVQIKGEKLDMNKVQVDEIVEAKPHLFFWDSSFVDVFWKSGVDFLIWYAPYKLLRTTSGLFELPKVAIFDCGADRVENITDYDSDKMCSSEL
ncbi:MAG: hypothetical protein K2H01_00470 [Ruminococcus sp.]|nr:hypothetical protein [Ruminococcus sp.]